MLHRLHRVAGAEVRVVSTSWVMPAPGFFGACCTAARRRGAAGRTIPRSNGDVADGARLDLDERARPAHAMHGRERTLSNDRKRNHMKLSIWISVLGVGVATLAVRAGTRDLSSYAGAARCPSRHTRCSTCVRSGGVAEMVHTLGVG